MNLLFVPLFVRHEVALWRSDGQHVPGEDHQPGEAVRDLQPGRSESCQGTVILHISSTLMELYSVVLGMKAIMILIVYSLLPLWNHFTWERADDSNS